MALKSVGITLRNSINKENQSNLATQKALMTAFLGADAKIDTKVSDGYLAARLKDRQAPREMGDYFAEGVEQEVARRERQREREEISNWLDGNLASMIERAEARDKLKNWSANVGKPAFDKIWTDLGKDGTPSSERICKVLNDSIVPSLNAANGGSTFRAKYADYKNGIIGLTDDNCDDVLYNVFENNPDLAKDNAIVLGENAVRETAMSAGDHFRQLAMLNRDNPELYNAYMADAANADAENRVAESKINANIANMNYRNAKMQTLNPEYQAAVEQAKETGKYSAYGNTAQQGMMNKYAIEHQRDYQKDYNTNKKSILMAGDVIKALDGIQELSDLVKADSSIKNYIGRGEINEALRAIVRNKLAGDEEKQKRIDYVLTRMDTLQKAYAPFLKEFFGSRPTNLDYRTLLSMTPKGFDNPDALSQNVDFLKQEIQGRIKELEEENKTIEPYLFRQGAVGGSSGNYTGGTAPMNDINTLEEVKDN